MKKCYLLFLLAALMFYSKAKANESEPNNSKAQANTLALNSSNSGKINADDDEDWWQVITNADGLLSVALQRISGRNLSLYIYDNDCVTELNHRNSVNGSDTVNVDGLAPGIYYLKITSVTNTGTSSYNISNAFTTASPANDIEPNGTADQATALPLGSSATGHVGYYYNHIRDSVDWYKVTTTINGRLDLTITVNSGNHYISMDVYDGDKVTRLSRVKHLLTSDTLETEGLEPGTYYVKVYCSNVNTDFDTYTVASSFAIAMPLSEPEPNNHALQALTLPLNSSVTGQVGYHNTYYRDSFDWYRVTTDADGELDLTLTINFDFNYISIDVFDVDTTTLISRESFILSSDTIKLKALAAGTYYVRVYCTNNNISDAYTLCDTLIVPSFPNDKEPNNSPSIAATLPANTIAYGHVGYSYLAYRDPVDWYKINYTGKSGELTMSFTLEPFDGHYVNWLAIYFYKDTTAPPIYHLDYIDYNGSFTLNSLDKGYYYVKVFTNIDYEWDNYSLTPTFVQTKPTIKVSSYNSPPDCNEDSITYKITGSHAPFTLSLYRFGTLYKTQTSKSTYVTFNSLPSGIYYASVYGDGGTGTAKGISDTLTIMPIPSGLQTSAIGADHAKFNWKVLPCADYYSVRYRATNTTAWIYVRVAGTLNHFFVKSLTPSTSYEWQISAIDSLNGMNAKSFYSSSITFVTTATAFAESNAYENDELSVNGKQQTIYLGVYPNPASSYFTIHYNTSIKDKINATLFDVNGKAVWASGSLTADALNGKQVNVNQFGSGLYYLKITDSKGLVIANTKVSVSK